MFEELVTGVQTYRIYGPHVYKLITLSIKGIDPYWSATDLPVNFLKNVLAKR